ncbi:MAG TPA: cation:proton antiporter [Candidatus Binataceae bacterium]|nr:cation:proton antiporter [Candidatus Binataceae bacterium]
MHATSHDLSPVLLELGLIVLGLAVLGRLAKRWSMSSIPLYLIAGLAFGHGGFAPLDLSRSFVELGAEIGVLLLLFMLGLEYTGDELSESLRDGIKAGVIDFVLNFAAGFAAGLLLGWNLLAAVLLGGVTWVSSSGVIARVLAELQRFSYPETPTVLSVLVIEDIAVALYLPLVLVLLVGGDAERVTVSVSIAVAAVVAVLFLAIRYGHSLSSFVAHQSDEVVLLTMFGIVLLVASIAQRFQVSSAIAAFLVGIALSGPTAEQSRRLLAPLRDLFAATFFFFFGLEIEPGSLVPVLKLAALLAAASAVTKILTGYWATRGLGTDRRGRLRAGLALIPRGEFSIVIAGIGGTIEPDLGALSAAYVLILAVVGPLLMKLLAQPEESSLITSDELRKSDDTDSLRAVSRSS